MVVWGGSWRLLGRCLVVLGGSWRLLGRSGVALGSCWLVHPVSVAICRVWMSPRNLVLGGGEFGEFCPPPTRAVEPKTYTIPVGRKGYRGYKGLQGLAKGYKGLQRLAKGYKGLQRVGT